MASLHTVLRQFDARDTWESYSRELEQYFEVERVLDDNERVAILLTVLSPSMYKVLRDSCRPELPRLKTYAELSELLKIHHSPQPSVFTQRIEFYKAKQASSESVNDWLARVVRLAASCDFGHQLDTMVNDNFVSGLAHQKVVRKLCEENSSATVGGLVDLAEEYTPLCCSETSILDLPNELLNHIILLLTARERVPLGNSCCKFKSLVFEDPEILRYLDFSKKGHLTTMKDIQQYFNNANVRKYILRINAKGVHCIEAGDLLNNSIGKAMNLVEVNIHGTRFEDIRQLGSFLKPLQHLKKLSINWPINDGNNFSLCKRILQRSFSRLSYLSVAFELTASTMFTSSLSLCLLLKELDMQVPDYSQPGICSNSWNSRIKQLTNLKSVSYCGQEAIRIKEELATVLPDPKRWTDFQLCDDTGDHLDHITRFYIEKDVEVCEELLQSKNLHDFLNTAPWENFNLKWAVNPEFLLKKVLRITHQDVPEDLCCLSTFAKGVRHLLKVEEVKLLLKDPRYQISHLYLNHDLKRYCDAHLLASGFPNLSKLVLSAVTTNLEKSPKDSYFQKRLSRRCSPIAEKQDNSSNLDSSFKMLVENTPHLRHLRLFPRHWPPIKNWNVDALCQISGWQNLETLDMFEIPCEDGEFLVEIGKQCKNLQRFSLRNYHHSCRGTGSEKVALLTMFEYCRNLRDLTIHCHDIDQVEMFTLITRNEELKRVEVIDGETKHSAPLWISSLENLIRQCAKLTTIICETRFKTEDDRSEVVPAVKRIRRECRRPDFQIKVTCTVDRIDFRQVVVGTAFED